VKTAELASVGVALGDDIEKSEMDGRIVLDRFREENESRARAEGGESRGNLLAQGLEQPELAQELALDG